MRKIYIDYGFFLAVTVIYIISYLLSYFFQMIFHSALWVVYGSFLFITIVMMYSTRMFLLLLKIQDTRGVFYGAIWRFEFRREWIEEIIVDTGGFIFKPKPEYEHKYRSVTKLTKGDWAGYRVVSFLNPNGLAAFIKIMKPITGDRINWDKMSEEKRMYWRELLYDA